MCLTRYTIKEVVSIKLTGKRQPHAQRLQTLNTSIHTDDDGCGFVLWIKGTTAAPIFHCNLTSFISFKCKC